MVGGIIKDAGSTVKLKTGSWRTFKPDVDRTKCTGCGVCAKFCPEGCVEIVDKKAEIDYDYCKGCLICQEECPIKAITSKVDEK